MLGVEREEGMGEHLDIEHQLGDRECFRKCYIPSFLVLSCTEGVGR